MSAAPALITIALTTLLGGAANADTGAGNVFTPAPTGAAFLPPAFAEAAARAAMDQAGAGSGCAAGVDGVGNTGPIFRDGDRVYVGQNGPSGPWTIFVINVETPGAEFIESEIEPPVNPVDVAVVGDEIYVIDQDRDELYYRALAGGPWSFIALPAEITEFTYGDIIYPFGDRMFVLHTWENTIDVVDLPSKTLLTTITDLEFLPNRVVFDSGKLIVLGVGLSAPSCLAFGPNFSVFDLDTLEKEYQKSIAGECAVEILADGGVVYVVFNESIKSYELASGDPIDALAAEIDVLGRHAELKDGELFAQTGEGEILRTPTSLSGFSFVCDVLTQGQVWIPPLEEMIIGPGDDDRLFITNRNDGSLTILDVPPACPGDVTGDLVVDSADLNAVLGEFGCGTTEPDSNCCFPNGGPGCDDPACEEMVCFFDPFCCQIEWDGLCVDAAIQMCGDLCAGIGAACATDIDVDGDTDSDDLNAVLSAFGAECGG